MGNKTHLASVSSSAMWIKMPLLEDEGEEYMEQHNLCEKAQGLALGEDQCWAVQPHYLYLLAVPS